MGELRGIHTPPPFSTGVYKRTGQTPKGRDRSGAGNFPHSLVLADDDRGRDMDFVAKWPAHFCQRGSIGDLWGALQGFLIPNRPGQIRSPLFLCRDTIRGEKCNGQNPVLGKCSFPLRRQQTASVV